VHQARGQVVLETADELSPLLGWLATLPLKAVTIEPVGLRAVYDRFHADGRYTGDSDDVNLEASLQPSST
jgi:ABC-2 type transport system ATP-binding protein